MALHGVMLLAKNSGKTMTTKDAAESLSVSEAHLSKMLQRLGKAGILRSIRGPNGGYMLVQGLSELRLLDIIEAVEGPVDISPCRFGAPACRKGSCVVGGLFADLNAQVLRHFEKRLSEI